MYRLKLGLYVYNRNILNLNFQHFYLHFIRFRSNLLRTFQRLSSTQKSIYYSAPRKWNSILVHIKNHPNSSAFKCCCRKYLNDHFHNHLTLYCTVGPSVLYFTLFYTSIYGSIQVPTTLFRIQTVIRVDSFCVFSFLHSYDLKVISRSVEFGSSNCFYVWFETNKNCLVSNQAISYKQRQTIFILI